MAGLDKKLSAFRTVFQHDMPSSLPISPTLHSPNSIVERRPALVVLLKHINIDTQQILNNLDIAQVASLRKRSAIKLRRQLGITAHFVQIVDDLEVALEGSQVEGCPVLVLAMVQVYFYYLD